MTAKDDIMIFEQRRRQAMIAADVATLNDLFAEDLLWIHGTARTDDKRGLLDSIASRKTVYHSIDSSEETVRFFGDTALLSGVADMKVRISGEDRLLKTRFTIAWARTGGQWQVVNWQSTSLPKPQN